jgi:hypothetical protein
MHWILIRTVLVMISTRSLLTLFIAGAVLGSRPPACRADDNIKIEVRVVAVLATSQNKNVDPNLQCLAKHVQKKLPDLTGFQLGQTSCEKLKVGDTFKFPLVDGQVAEVSIHRGPGKEDRIGLTIKPPMAGEIVYGCPCGKFFPIITRYQTKTNERLIIAVSVQCCKKCKDEEK